MEGAEDREEQVWKGLDGTAAQGRKIMRSLLNASYLPPVQSRASLLMTHVYVLSYIECTTPRWQCNLAITCFSPHSLTALPLPLKTPLPPAPPEMRPQRQSSRGPAAAARHCDVRDGLTHLARLMNDLIDCLREAGIYYHMVLMGYGCAL